MKVEKNLKWETVTAEFNRALDRLGPYLSPSEHATRLPDHRRQDGAQAIFYRINEVIPVLDGRGGIRFAPDGREMDEWIKCRDEKDHGVRLPGLIDRYPERVAAMNYWFVDEQDMQRARRLGTFLSLSLSPSLPPSLFTPLVFSRKMLTSLIQPPSAKDSAENSACPPGPSSS